MFGVEDDKLIEGLERLRARLCQYGYTPGNENHRCDCKYGASFKGEESGCPEVALAITYLRGEFEKVYVFKTEQERKATRTLGAIRQLLVEEQTP